MTIQLTDAQIVRVLELCAKVGAIAKNMPVMPGGYARDPEAQLELAKNLRSSLEQMNDALVELGALLR